MFTEVKKRYRYSLILLKELVRTDFKVRYQGSTLGYIWAVLRPLLLFVILYIVFVYFLRIGRGVEHWPVALLLGLVVWNFFIEVTNQGLKSIVNQGSMIRKINFPKYVILISTTISALINLGINLLIVAIFMVINGVKPDASILLAPLFFLELFVFALGAAFILSTLYVKFRDLNFIWEVFLQGLFYGSVILYPVSFILGRGTGFAELILLNPVAQSIQSIRRSVIPSEDMHTLYSISDNIFLSAVPILFVVAVFIFGALYFKHKSPTFAEEA